ncbi:hypothetical protein M758_4G213700 [Ceratodon purpureus]|nr:hypothetical protein M758_4G213700 [Ceratodon purpureus]
MPRTRAQILLTPLALRLQFLWIPYEDTPHDSKVIGTLIKPPSELPNMKLLPLWQQKNVLICLSHVQNSSAP